MRSFPSFRAVDLAVGLALAASVAAFLGGCAPLRHHTQPGRAWAFQTEAALFASPRPADVTEPAVPPVRIPQCSLEIVERVRVGLRACPGRPSLRAVRVYHVVREAVCTLDGQEARRELAPVLETDARRCTR